MASLVPLKVTLADGTVHDIVATDKDIIALEERFDIDASILPVRKRMIWLAFLAWNVLSAKGVVNVDFDEWKKTDFGIDGKEAAPSGNA